MLEKQFQAHKVRIIDNDGEPLFVAADVAEILGIANIRPSLINYDETEKQVSKTYLISGKRDTLFLTEKGLYKFLGRTNSPKAKQFQDWVYGEIIPTIRKTGKYETVKPADDISHLIASTKALIEKIEADRPKVEVYDKIVDTNGLHSVSEAAKILGTGQKRLYADLRTKNILTNHNVPYQEYIDRGYFEVKETLINIGRGKTKPHAQAFVTGKGITWLANKTLYTPKLVQ